MNALCIAASSSAEAFGGGGDQVSVWGGALLCEPLCEALGACEPAWDACEPACCIRE